MTATGKRRARAAWRLGTRAGVALLALAGCRGDANAGAARAGAAPAAGASATASARTQATSDESNTASAEPASERLAVDIVARYPHDPEAFTQGFLWHDGKLYESTGLYGRSSVRRVDLQTGHVEAVQPLPSSFFGEGLALAGDRLLQITWREGVAFAWDVRTFAARGQHTYRGEGWGLTTVGDRLLQSDGTSRLTWRDPATFAETGRLDVRERGKLVPLLNELEAVGDAVYANVWTTDDIVRIDLATGRVTARIDASPLHAEVAQKGGDPDVLNGIAWRPETKTFLVTGKQWPLVFEVRFR